MNAKIRTEGLAHLYKASEDRVAVMEAAEILVASSPVVAKCSEGIAFQAGLRLGFALATEENPERYLPNMTRLALDAVLAAREKDSHG